MQYKDYYKILGVDRQAKPEEIKRAYRKLARKYHPDVSKEADAEARFKEINEAHEVLKDEEKRAAYDQLGSGWRAGDEFRPPPGQYGFHRHYQTGMDEADLAGFSDFFESLFGREFSGSTHLQGADQTAKLLVSLEDAYRGAQRTLQLEVPEPDHRGGVVNRRRRLKVKIPPGVTQGSRIRLHGQGLSRIPGGPRGDLFLEIDLQPHPFFRVEERDILIDLPITPWEAALGSSVTIPTLEGPVNLKIPPGSQSGQRMRMRGRGLPGSPPGDQFAVLQIRVPAASNERLKHLYRELADESGYNPRAELGV